MKIGILVSSIGNFGKQGFYNSQEVGLAKALNHFFEEVKIYKLVQKNQEKQEVKMEGCRCTSILYLPAKNWGINGIVDTKELDPGLNVLLYFSDTQISVPRVYRWAKKHSVRFLPYIGVTESHSTRACKKVLIDLLFERNLRIYQKHLCLVKTPDVAERLFVRGVKNTVVSPVGLDPDLLNPEYANASVSELRAKYGYTADEKILLFIGRLTEEKQPLRLIDIFSRLAKKDASYRLLIVGSGELEQEVLASIARCHLEDKVTLVPGIPNAEIWQLYRIADAFVNLNPQEIFGMAILEAMYYECKVVAWNAPGPGVVIENGKSGWIVSGDEEVVEKIMDPFPVGKAAHERVISAFTWETTANKIREAIGQ